MFPDMGICDNWMYLFGDGMFFYGQEFSDFKDFTCCVLGSELVFHGVYILAGAYMILVTGGAGFIGSALIRRLNADGQSDFMIVDSIRDSLKWRNLIDCQFHQYLDATDLQSAIKDYRFSQVIHLGANSNSTETDFTALYRANTEYTRHLWLYCVEHKIPFLYASSAATYGDGSAGFSDDHSLIPPLRPLSAYAYSKHLFDRWALEQPQKPPRWYGLKFFNVYGPGEWHKGKSASMIYQMIQHIKSRGCVSLFGDGEQSRDFISIHDVVDIILFFLYENPSSGIYNVGTGKAHTYNQIAGHIFKALGVEPDIQYDALPENLSGVFQMFTQADISKLRAAGFKLSYAPYHKAIQRVIKEMEV